MIAIGKPLSQAVDIAPRYKRRIRRPIQIEGSIAYVPLTKGNVAVIDTQDVPLVADRNWHAKRYKTGAIYACAVIERDGRLITIRMHRLLTDAPDGLEVDHRDGNGLNNRRGNLRVCDKPRNQANARIRKDNTSGFRGVSRKKWRSQWRWAAYLQVDGKRALVGYFKDPEEAARAYDSAARLAHGQFASLNFPQEGERAARAAA